MMAQRFNGLSSGRKSAVIAGAVLLLGLLAFGGWTVFRGPATPEDSQRALWKYLRKEARTRNFVPELDLASASLTNAGGPITITYTNKSGKVKTVTRTPKPSKSGATSLPDTSISFYFRTNQMRAETYQEMYKLIGQQLFVAEKFLADTNEERQIIGIIMACEASNYARTNALNLWLGARVCEAYLWPNLDLAENTNSVVLSEDALLNVCESAFQEAGETNNIIRNYELMIARVSRSAAYIDLLRYRLAHIYQDLGQEEKALPWLKEIKNYRMNRVPQEIAAMEDRLKRK